MKERQEEGGLYDMVEESLELARENNKILRKMRRSARWNFVFRLVWIAVLVGVPVYVYYVFLQPYVGDISESYSGFRESIEAMRAFFEQFQSVDLRPSSGGMNPPVESTP